MRKFALLLVILTVFLPGLCQAKDLRAVRLEKFFAQYPKSPLKNHIDDILYYADKFGLDYRLYIAISGAESTLGMHHPKGTSNFTGYNNGSTKFNSIDHNIYETNRVIAQGKWYKKYRNTKNINDLVYVYKGVPPYDRYINTLHFFMNKISSVSIAREKRAQELYLALQRELNKQKREQSIIAWHTIRYDQFPSRRKIRFEMSMSQI